MDIIPVLVKIKYEDHILLLLKDVADEPYEFFPSVPSAPIKRILHSLAQGLNKSGLLGLINMPHLRRLNEVNTCIKQLLAYFHGGTLGLDTPIVVTVDMISEIMGLLKAREDPAQYLRGRDNDKKLAQQLKERYGL